MKYFSILGIFRRELSGAARLGATPPSRSRRIGINRLGRLWSTIARPFHRSIHVRLQYAFGFSVLGLVIMAAITIVSDRFLLSAYETGVSEARFELMSAHRLQVSLREAEHLIYLYAIEGDRSAPADFEETRITVDRQFQQLTENQLRFASYEHAHSHISVPQAIKAWQDAQAAVLQVFHHATGTTEAIEALRRAHAAIDPHLRCGL